MKKFNLFQVNRVAGWILFFSITAFLVSGLGLAKGIISYQLAAQIHLGWLIYLLLVAFVLHTFLAFRLLFMRRQIWNWITKIILVIFYIVFGGFFVYVGLFYHKPVPVIDSTKRDIFKNENVDNNVNDIQAALPEKIFTASELSLYNGQNGQPSYVAVDGIVYDVSSVFRDGKHQGVFAGQDLSVSFHNQHMQSILSNFTVVGKLK